MDLKTSVVEAFDRVVSSGAIERGSNWTFAARRCNARTSRMKYRSQSDNLFGREVVSFVSERNQNDVQRTGTRTLAGESSRQNKRRTG